MDGILSGFRFGAKKTSTPSSEQNESNKNHKKNSPLSEPSKPNSDSTESAGSTTQPTGADKSSAEADSSKVHPKGEATQASESHSNFDRSTDMRLTKNAPPKQDDDFDIPSDPVVPSYNSPTSPSAGTQSTNVASPAAVIGPKITFKGELTGEEDLLIQGRVEGTIDLKGNILTVGSKGVVKANLMAKTITIEGTVEGDLIGQEKIEIKSSSNVKGNLVAASVILEDGAKFRGSIDMDTSGKSSFSNASKSSSQTQDYSKKSSNTPPEKA